MYISKLTRETNWDTIANFIRENGFGLLVNTDPAGVPHATHLPMTLVEKTPGEFVLRGHIARINPQWEWFEKNEGLAVFSGHHAYISSSWYEKERIPTWNYMAVHIHGSIRIQEEAAVVAALGDLMDHYEAASACPVHMSDIDDKTLRNNVKAIVGFEMSIRDVNANYKLSQNKKDADYYSVIAHLKALGDENSLRVAAEMEARRPSGK
ncbi:FMN-binding negative transcriptional regulator [Chitinophaga arvensicola]|uniref:Negative transcriptional regulator, PaiB family n=1 Tax=Chitinophaga arvensicola TaxID=29529 RepID=A0A1I0SCC8_9BACT|nr:FMN-binding negative transcriptional regulator [Chitinophaga arvensicola]SEW54478.1 negative transcriptional regulator, PaiB family [Chitinophaga arvensicola]